MIYFTYHADHHGGHEDHHGGHEDHHEDQHFEPEYEDDDHHDESHHGDEGGEGEGRHETAEASEVDHMLPHGYVDQEHHRLDDRIHHEVGSFGFILLSSF